MEATLAKPRLASLLEHFSRIGDDREPWRVVYPLPEVLLLVVCATIAGCDDYDEIADWGEAHLSFLRGLSEFYHGVPCEDWLRSLMNRIDPALFSACFSSWVSEQFPSAAPEMIAIDGKTSRRRHERAAGKRALPLVSAFASPERLARAVRSHWAIENSLHWVLDVAFKEDLSRLRAGHGATNMAIVRHFALTLVRQAKDKRSIKTRRKRAGWDTSYLKAILNPEPC